MRSRSSRSGRVGIKDTGEEGSDAVEETSELSTLQGALLVYNGLAIATRFTAVCMQFEFCGRKVGL